MKVSTFFLSPVKGVGLFMFFSLNGESFFFRGNSLSGKRAEALISGVGGGTWGSGSGCANGDLFGGGSMSSGVELRSSLLSISSDRFFLVSNWVRPQLYRSSMINGSFLVIVGSTRAFLSILLPGSKTVRATGAIDVLGSFGCLWLLL